MSQWLGDHTAEKPREGSDIRTSFRTLTFSGYYTEERLWKDASDLKLTEGSERKVPEFYIP